MHVFKIIVNHPYGNNVHAKRKINFDKEPLIIVIIKYVSGMSAFMQSKRETSACLCYGILQSLL